MPDLQHVCKRIGKFLLGIFSSQLPQMKSKDPIEEVMWKGLDHHIGRRALLSSGTEVSLNTNARYVKQA